MPPGVRRVLIRWSVILAAVAAAWVTLVLNADILRDRYQADFDFGEREMLQVIEDINRGGGLRFRYDGHSYLVVLDVKQAPGKDRFKRSASRSEWKTVAHACGSRTFRQSAAACLDTTTVPLEGVATLLRVGLTSPLIERREVTGELTADGRSLGRMRLRLKMAEDYLLFRADEPGRFELDSALLNRSIYYGSP